MDETSTRTIGQAPFKDPAFAREAGKKGGIASGVSRRQRGRKQLERIVMQSKNGYAALAYLRDLEAKDRAEQRRREREVESLEQRAARAQADAIDWDRYGERLVDQLHSWEAERDDLEARVEELRELEAKLRGRVEALADEQARKIVDDDGQKADGAARPETSAA